MRIAGALCLLFVFTSGAAHAAETAVDSQLKDCGNLAGRYTDSRGLTIWVTRIGDTRMQYTEAGAKVPAFVLELENLDGRGTLHGFMRSAMFAGPPSEEFPEPIEWRESLELPAGMHWLSDDGVDIIADFGLIECEAPPSKTEKPTDAPKPAQ
jgi:hypothetical protein